MTAGPVHTTYRGYDLVTDEWATDIWSGPQHVCTERGVASLAKARKMIDEWVETDVR